MPLPPQYIDIPDIKISRVPWVPPPPPLFGRISQLFTAAPPTSKNSLKSENKQKLSLSPEEKSFSPADRRGHPVLVHRFIRPEQKEFESESGCDMHESESQDSPIHQT